MILLGIVRNKKVVMKADKISWLGLIGLIVILGAAYLLDGHWQWASGIWG